MARILKEKGLFLVWSEDFYFLTWKLEEKYCACESTIRSSDFHFGGKEKDSYFEIYSDDYTLYLYLHNPLTFDEGHFEISITDAEHQSIFRRVASSKCADSDNLLDGFDGDLESIKPKYPLLITCVLINSDDNLSKMANETIVDSALLNDLKELSFDLKKALGKNMHADVSLKIGEDSIKAHKMILQARSPVFDKMFCNESLENLNNEVVISDIQAKAVERLVNYLYTATVEECDFEDTLELYCAADKYEVLSLRDNCRKNLLKLLQVDNACTLFALAHRHCDEDLKERVVEFASAKFKSVVNSDSFDELNKDEMKLLMRLCVSAMKDEEQ